MFVKGFVLLKSQAISSDFLFMLKAFIESSELLEKSYLIYSPRSTANN